ncbi:ATP-binding cassette domain-containing protein [Thermodesulfobacteriota bacterium]
MPSQLKQLGSVVQMANTTIMDENTGHIAVTGLNMDLQFSDLALIYMGHRESALVIGDACEGLTLPTVGKITFLGYNWPDSAPDQANALRGMVGRVFRRNNWVDYMSVFDSILLPQLHHTKRPMEELEKEARELSQMFGLPGIPTRRPGKMLETDLQRAACVRAFMGRPRLLILEEPTRGLGEGFLPGLTKAIDTARAMGTAVLWFTQSDSIWRKPYVNCTYRFRAVGSGLVEAAA